MRSQRSSSTEVATRVHRVPRIGGIASDWIDGAIARRGGAASYGARFNLEPDSVLTLGAEIAAARRGLGSFLVLAPVARYAVAAVRDPGIYTANELFWDRVTGVGQMALLVAALSPPTLGALRVLAGPVTAARCAALTAALMRSRAVHFDVTGDRRRPALVRAQG